MAQPVFVITMSVPVARGAIRTLVFRTDQSFKDLPDWVLKRGSNGEQAFPVHAPRPYGITGTGNPPPVPLPVPGEKRGSPVSRNVGVGPRTDDDEHNLRDRLREARSYQADLMARSNELQDELAVSDGEEANLTTRLTSTHGRGWDFSPEAKAMRAPMFERKTQLAVAYGPKRIKRREINSARRAMTREVDFIEKQIARVAQKRRGRTS